MASADLASTLARELYEVDRLGAFFDIIHQDPVYPSSSSLRSRGTWESEGIRWAIFRYSGVSGTANTAMLSAASGKATEDLLSESATRLSGSSGLYQSDGRKPYASINFITCHDGTLRPGQL